MSRLETAKAWAHHDLTGVPEELRRDVRAVKAYTLERMACRIQDQLNDLQVYIGDEDLVDAKEAIYQACQQARSAGERYLRHFRDLVREEAA